MPIRDLFVSDVTRDIPPVVYFHEQSPERLAAEVSEYIVTGGWPKEHPNHRRVPDGIHEQYIRLLRGICAELDKPGGPSLPTSWISGFYGSGKSSFAKLLGLALDGAALPDGRSLADAWLQRDSSPLAGELREAWRVLRQRIDPIAVVFDVGGVARENEQVHAVALRQVQRRLGYCANSPMVADYELGIEEKGDWPRFEETALRVLGGPWSQHRDDPFADDRFSQVLSALYPDLYTDPMSWVDSRVGTHSRSESPQEAVRAIRAMLERRRPGATLFLVIDEVSQYVLSNKDREDRLRAFASALGAELKGRAWLLALGQQKLDEEAGQSFLVWAKDRFPPHLRVHLQPANIRDVVHRRLLQKTPAAQALLGGLFEQHRADLRLFAYGCDEVTPEAFVEVYPLLPGHIDLLLQITTAMRSRSSRVQGDDQAIRGLLQLLGELFRAQRLADRQVGDLITLDQIYEIQHTALDADVQNSMSRLQNQCSGDGDALLMRAAKVVALLELIQDVLPTTAERVARCLYDRLDRGNQQAEVTEALETLRRRNLLGYSEQGGYKIQSTAGEEWERDRRGNPVSREARSLAVKSGLEYLLATPEQPRLDGRPFPWSGLYSDTAVSDQRFGDQRADAVVRVDFRLLPKVERAEALWIKRSDESQHQDRLVWICGASDTLEDLILELEKSRAMLRRYEPRRESLTPAFKLLLQQEKNRADDLEGQVRKAVAAVWMDGTLYFRGRKLQPQDYGTAFPRALNGAATGILPQLYQHFVVTDLTPSECLQLIAPVITGPSPKLLPEQLGILELDNGRFVPTCNGQVPRRVREYIETEQGLSGLALIGHFGGPPFGYTPTVVKACVAGLLAHGNLRIQTEGNPKITAVRDAGVQELFESDRVFRRAVLFPMGEGDVSRQDRARICRFLEDQLQRPTERQNDAIADAVAELFPGLAERQRGLLAKLNRLPGAPAAPTEIDRLGEALEQILRVVRNTQDTLLLLKRYLDRLRDGVQALLSFDAELTDSAIGAVNAAAGVRDFQIEQLRAIARLEIGPNPNSDPNLEAAAQRVEQQLAAPAPWRDIGSLDPDLVALRAAYTAERRHLIEAQEAQAELVRRRVKGRDGFATLTADQSHRVLRPIALAVVETTEDAVAPSLIALRDAFLPRLAAAEDDALDILDQLLEPVGPEPITRKVNLDLRNRTVATEAEVNTLLEEIRRRLMEQIRAGARVRIL